MNPLDLPEPNPNSTLEEARTVTLGSIGQGLAILADDVKKLATTNNNNTKRLEAIEAELKATKAEVAALKAKKPGQKSKKSAI